MLVHLVDSSEYTGRDAAHDFDVILDELANFSEQLAEKPMIVVASKIDACQEPERIEVIRQKAKSSGMPFLEISSVTGIGLDELRFLLREAVFKPEPVTAANPVATIEHGS